MDNTNRLEGLNIPKHIAIILDGNGRWATSRKLPRALGHKAGCETLEKTVEDCARLGVDYLTVYGFSTENWKRSAEEVGALMQLFKLYMVKLLKVTKDNNVKAKMIGDRTRFDSEIIKGINKLEHETQGNTGMTFVFAVNYGARDEITRAFKNMLIKYDNKEFDINSVDIEFISDNLDTSGIPDPELLIRTSGEFRISNFLLWQIAYSEIYITDVLWPDFDMSTLEDAIISYNHRERRFGGRKS